MSYPVSFSDDEVFEALRALIREGEHRDELFGIPGACLEGGGAFRQNADGSLQRVYYRGTKDYTEAKMAGLVERLPPPPDPASTSALVDAEKSIGAPLPPLLRRIYLGLASGGFGPGYGIFGVRGGHLDENGHDVVASFHGWQRVWKEPKPLLLPICHWGCAIYSFIDLASPSGSMWGYDPNPVPNDHRDKALVPQRISFATWLGRWAAGNLHQPTAVQDAVTGEWRAATDDEYEAMMAET